MTKRVVALLALCITGWLVPGCGSKQDKPAASTKTDTNAVHDHDAAAPEPRPDAGTTSGTTSGTTPSTTNLAANKTGDYPDPRGACDIHSGYSDDHACLKPPAPGEGMQIHVGPLNYDDPEEIKKFVMHPGQENSECWTFHTPNDEPVYYQTFVLSGRAGTHHIINTMFNDSQQLTEGKFGACADGGTGSNTNIIDNLPGASKAYMPRGHVAPENAHVGRKIPAHAGAQADMHYFNFTDHDIIREFWMNVYFAKPEDITEDAQQIRGMGGFKWSQQPIAPRTDMVYSYSCPISGDGRILSLLGHYHSHGKQFTASIKRKDGDIQKVFEMYDYMDPATFEYDSMTKNPAFSDNSAGAMSGVLEVHDGDTLLWDCHIINDSDVGLTYKNEVKTGEMCNLWGESLGIKTINCLIP
jgi:hypothetical protein